MQICAAADIHYPKYGKSWTRSLAEEMCTSGADVIILAGDICNGEQSLTSELLDMFSDFDGHKLFVPGNHDLWQTIDAPDTDARYRRVLPDLAVKAGFHYLPNAPIVIGDVGFAGTIGWYDYSFRVSEPPREPSAITVMQPYRTEGGTSTRPLPDRDEISFDELTDDDYALGAVAWTEQRSRKRLVWNDAIYTNWGISDPEVVEKLVRELKNDIDEIADSAERLVGVSHFLPFEELMGGAPETIGDAFSRAYMGSEKLGEVFLDNPEFRLLLCGHYHQKKVLQADTMVVANCSVAEEEAGPLLLTLPES